MKARKKTAASNQGKEATTTGCVLNQRHGVKDSGGGCWGGGVLKYISRTRMSVWKCRWKWELFLLNCSQRKTAPKYMEMCLVRFYISTSTVT